MFCISGQKFEDICSGYYLATIFGEPKTVQYYQWNALNEGSPDACGEVCSREGIVTCIISFFVVGRKNFACATKFIVGIGRLQILSLL